VSLSVLLSSLRVASGYIRPLDTQISQRREKNESGLAEKISETTAFRNCVLCRNSSTLCIILSQFPIWKSVQRRQLLLCACEFKCPVVITSVCRSPSHFATDGQSASPSWCRARFGTHDQILSLKSDRYSVTRHVASSLTTGRVCYLLFVVVFVKSVHVYISHRTKIHTQYIQSTMNNIFMASVSPGNAQQIMPRLSSSAVQLLQQSPCLVKLGRKPIRRMLCNGAECGMGRLYSCACRPVSVGSRGAEPNSQLLPSIRNVVSSDTFWLIPPRKTSNNEASIVRKIIRV
jgi:hypothetical protein